MHQTSARRFALTVALIVAAASVTPAYALPKKFEGKSVTVLIRGGTNNDNTYVWGTCTGMDETGVWIDQTHQQYMPGSSSKTEHKETYIPWSSITLIRPDNS